jgi:hypothetical protein
MLGGYAAGKFGGKVSLIFSIGSLSVTSLLIPEAARFDYRYVKWKEHNGRVMTNNDFFFQTSYCHPRFPRPRVRHRLSEHLPVVWRVESAGREGHSHEHGLLRHPVRQHRQLSHVEPPLQDGN